MCPAVRLFSFYKKVAGLSHISWNTWHRASSYTFFFVALICVLLYMYVVCIRVWCGFANMLRSTCLRSKWFFGLPSYPLVCPFSSLQEKCFTAMFVPGYCCSGYRLPFVSTTWALHCVLRAVCSFVLGSNFSVSYFMATEALYYRLSWTYLVFVGCP